MAVPAFSCLRPYSTFTHQQQNLLFPITSYSRSSSFSYKIRIQLTPPRKRFVHISPLNSASINGYRIENGNQNDFLEEKNVKVKNRLRRLIDKLPGGSWWRLSTDQVDDTLAAEPVSVLKALLWIWDLISEDRRVVFAAFSALLISSLSEISIPHFLTASIFSAQNSNISKFHQNVSILVFMCIISGISSCMRACFFGVANMILVKRIRESLYTTLLFQDISFFDSETVGDLTSRLGADCQQVSRIIGRDMNMILRNVLQGTSSLIYLLVLSFPLGLCTLAICSALSAVMLLYGQYQKRVSKLIQDFGASANEVAQETFSLMRTVRVYGTEKQEVTRYKHWLDKLADVSLRQSAAYGVWNLSFNTLYHSTQVIAVLVGGMFILAGHISAEQLTKFILYSEWLIYSTWLMADHTTSLMQSIGASEKVFQLMDLPPSSQFTAKGSKLQRLVGQVEFMNVAFSYPSRTDVPVLQCINFKVNPHEVVAIVGLSGSGKSTLVNLLLRLYEPSSGQIMIDGHPIKDLDIKWLRGRIGYVGQEPRLFRTDISSNIRYGCTRVITQQDVEWAAKQAYAHEFISSLPNGYQTLVDDDLLSGGQKQRIAIARALLRDPDILILDEATSALDAESEHNIKGVLHAIRSDLNTKRTVIVIAHRLSTIQAADRIVVMEGGQIVEVGSHAELLRRDGLYSRLTRRQADAVATS